MSDDDRTTRETLIRRLCADQRGPQWERDWSAFMAQYEKRMFHLGRRLGLDDAGAHDAVQEAMVSLMSAMTSPAFSYDSERRFRAYVWRAARSGIRRALRRAEPRHDEVVERAGHTRWTKEQAEVREALSRRFKEAHFQRGLEVLDDDARAILLHDGPDDELAERLGKSVGAIRTKRSRVKDKLEQILWDLPTATGAADVGNLFPVQRLAFIREMLVHEVEPSSSPRLLYREPGKLVDRIELDADREIGRRTFAVVDPEISSAHIRVTRGAHGDWLLTDLGSTNGTRINGGEPLASGQAWSLLDGDMIEIGHKVLVFLAGDDATAAMEVGDDVAGEMA